MPEMLAPQRRRLLSAAPLVAMAGAWPASSRASDDYPAKPARVLVPFTPGGSTDLLARGLAKHYGEVWKQAFIVENKPSAGGIIALKAALDGPADGYTLIVHSDGYAIAPAIYRHLPYDVQRDFSPLALLARASNLVAVAVDSPYRSLNDLVRAGRSPGALSYASAGVGSAQHMQAAKFAAHTGINRPVHVPFRGTPQALADVISRQVDFIFAPMSNALPMLKAGKLRGLAVSTAERDTLVPEIPTVAEAGYPGFAEQQWWGLFAPSQTPESIRRKIENEARVALRTPAMQELITRLSSSTGDLFGADFARLVTASITTNTQAAQAAGIKAD